MMFQYAVCLVLFLWAPLELTHTPFYFNNVCVCVLSVFILKIRMALTVPGISQHYMWFALSFLPLST